MPTWAVLQCGTFPPFIMPINEVLLFQCLVLSFERALVFLRSVFQSSETIKFCYYNFISVRLGLGHLWVNQQRSLPIYPSLDCLHLFLMPQTLWSMGALCGADAWRTWHGAPLSWSLVKYQSDSPTEPKSPRSLTFPHMRIGHLFLLLASLPLQQFLIHLIHW